MCVAVVFFVEMSSDFCYLTMIGHINIDGPVARRVRLDTVGERVVRCESVWLCSLVKFTVERVNRRSIC